jgi:hypothetical protein
MVNGHNASAAAMAGHTTGGRSESSDEVTAIPLEKWNGCQRSEGSGVRGKRFSRK